MSQRLLLAKKEAARLREQAEREARRLAAIQKSKPPAPAPAARLAVAKHMTEDEIKREAVTTALIFGRLPPDKRQGHIDNWHGENVAKYGTYLAQEILKHLRENLNRGR